PLSLSGVYPSLVPASPRKIAAPSREDGRAIQQEADRLVQDRYAPPGVVLDGDLQIIQFRGQTGQFLEPAAGEPSHNILKMAREGLVYGLGSVLNDTRKADGPVRKAGLRVRPNGGWLDVEVEALPLTAAPQPHYLVLFPQRSVNKPAKPVDAPRRRQKGPR